MKTLFKVRIILSVWISFQISSAPLISYASQGPQASALAVSEQMVHDDSDPIWNEFVKTSPGPLELKFDPKDPAIDHDPFFLRSQSWAEVEGANDLGFIKTKTGLQVLIPGSKRALNIDRPLNPLHATSEFVFFSLDKNSDLFKKAAGSENSGEGLFFINRSDLFEKSFTKESENVGVPIFFLPLPGQGWTGSLYTLELVPSDQLVIANAEGVAIPIDLKDVETIMKAEQLNLLMAYSLTVKNRNLNQMEIFAPAPGSTAAFGVFFTGLDLENVSQSIWPPINQTGFLEYFKKFKTDWLSSLLIPKAQADLFSSDVRNKLIFIGSVLTGMLAVSVILKYAHPGIRQKISVMHPKKVDETVLQTIKREAIGVSDILAHVTTFAYQLPAVTVGNAFEMFLDRFAPSMAASDHTLIRRFLNNTFYFARENVAKTPVSGKTMALGALVLGSIDTATVVFQYFVFNPWFGGLVAPFLPDKWQHRVTEVYDDSNANTRQIAINDSARNFAAHLVGGASSYSLEAKGAMMGYAKQEADKALKRQGKDPMSPLHQTERKKLIDEKIEIILKQQGLPGEDRFLFDADSVFSAMTKALGNSTPQDLQGEQSYLLAKRMGLTKPALRKALEVAQQYAQEQPSEVTSQIVSMFKEMSSDIGMLTNGLKNGPEGLKRAKKVRQRLTLLSAQGAVDWSFKYIDGEWAQKFSAESAKMAGLIFRQSLYSFLSKEGDALIRPLKDHEVKFGQQAIKNIESQMQAEQPGSSLTSEQAKFEKQLRIQIEINRLAQEQVDKDEATNFKPARVGWFEMRQRHRAEVFANEALGAQVAKSGGTISRSEANELWKGFYRNGMAKQVGLQLESKGAFKDQDADNYTKMLSVVENITQERMSADLKNIKGLAAYLEKISPLERLKIEAAMYATHYLDVYRSKATEGNMIHPLDPQQPGAFQKIRQTSIVRESVFLTRTLRLMESFTNDQAILPGFMAFMGRNVPLFDDMWQSHQRLLKMFLPLVTTSYLWNYFAWQVHMPFGTWVLFVSLVGATIWAPTKWLNRAFRMNNLKAMDGIVSKAIFAIPYAWVTFFGLIPATILAPEANKLVDSIRDPAMGMLGQISMEEWLAIGSGVILTKMGMDVKANSHRWKKNLEKLKPARQVPAPSH